MGLFYSILVAGTAGIDTDDSGMRIIVAIVLGDCKPIRYSVGNILMSAGFMWYLLFLYHTIVLLIVSRLSFESS